MTASLLDAYQNASGVCVDRLLPSVFSNAGDSRLLRVQRALGRRRGDTAGPGPTIDRSTCRRGEIGRDSLYRTEIHVLLSAVGSCRTTELPNRCE
jgi:hypothetical protein